MLKKNKNAPVCHLTLYARKTDCSGLRGFSCLFQVSSSSQFLQKDGLSRRLLHIIFSQNVARIACSQRLCLFRPSLSLLPSFYRLPPAEAAVCRQAAWLYRRLHFWKVCQCHRMQPEPEWRQSGPASLTCQFALRITCKSMLGIFTSSWKLQAFSVTMKMWLFFFLLCMCCGLVVGKLWNKCALSYLVAFLTINMQQTCGQSQLSVARVRSQRPTAFVSSRKWRKWVLSTSVVRERYWWLKTISAATKHSSVSFHCCSTVPLSPK